MFKFKHFDIIQNNNAQKVGTDSMVLGAWVAQKNISPKNILDIGTGTGVLALMMAQSFENAKVSAVEIEKSFAKEAILNFENSKYSDRLNVVQDDVLSFAPEMSFDVIISNPPYFENDQHSEDELRNLARHQDSLSLTQLINFCSRHLSEDGDVFLVYPFEVEGQMNVLCKRVGLGVASVLRLVHKNVVKRSCFHIKRGEGEVKYKDLVLRDSSGKYSADYIALTKEFHGTVLK